jgi:hypothetical protein
MTKEEPIPTCDHIMPNGEFCESPALSKDQYCYFHRSLRERTRRQARHARQQKPLEIPYLESIETIQLSVSEVLNALLTDRIDVKKAGLILYGLQTAAAIARYSNFRVFDCDTRVTRYTEYEESTLQQEIDQDARRERKQAERAQRKAAQKEAAEALLPEPAPAAAETEAPADETADPAAVLPEKKPGARVSQPRFWAVVRDVARQNAAATALEAERLIVAADKADEEAQREKVPAITTTSSRNGTA